MKKTKVMFSGQNVNMLLDSSMWPCGVCQSGVGSNSTFCSGCKHWVHKTCTRICGRLAENARCVRCDRCSSLARLIDGCPCNSIALGTQTLEAVDSFSYLGDTINADYGCTHGAIARPRSAWGKLTELLPLLTDRYIHIKTVDTLYNCLGIEPLSTLLRLRHLR